MYYQLRPPYVLCYRFFSKVDSEDVQLKVNEAGKPTGIAMVKFPSTELALEAMEQKNEKHFLGRPLQLFLQNKLT